MGGLMNELLMIYGVTASSSLIYNTMFFYNMHRHAKNKTKRKFKYIKNLSFNAKKEMNLIFLSVAFDGIVNSLIPVKNVFYTIENIEFQDELQESFTEEYDQVAQEDPGKAKKKKVYKYNNMK